nr:tight adherance operon protein [Pantoea sp. 201603H]
MLLFQSDKGLGYHSPKNLFYVVSSRKNVGETLCEQFRMAGVEAVEQIAIDITQVDVLNIPTNADGVVIDVGNNEDVSNIINALRVLIPRTVWCCVVGDSDSISVAQNFAVNDLHYFNINTQYEAIIHNAIAKRGAVVSRSAVHISILGCKGGVGSTTIGYQLASAISSLKRSPGLFIQGAGGSVDLDLVVGKKLLKEITQVQKHLDVIGGQSACFPEVSEGIMKGYNFIFFEQSIHSANKENLRQVIENSHCIVLVIDRSMSAIRVAKNVIENIEQLQKIRNISRRLVICLNDSRPVTMGGLNQDDINSLIRNRIDTHFPYNKATLNGKLERLLRTQSPQEDLVKIVLGKARKNKYTSATPSLFSRIARRKA